MVYNLDDDPEVENEDDEGNYQSGRHDIVLGKQEGASQTPKHFQALQHNWSWSP